ncbi:efflux RND transporter periplasmic adaptor subunit [Rhodobacteraceae bacterium]|nr:efflux RND transporter periplasmic adaptor subunit [Paracoccaceae bacterium]
MRLFSVITAILVVAVLYFVVLERDALFEFAGAEASAPAISDDAETTPDATKTSADALPQGVSVVAMQSTAQTVNGAVVLRGNTEASRQVELRAETIGRIISTPTRRGAMVSEGDLLCVLDPGTRQIALVETQARLREAVTRVPEAEARLLEARARSVEAEINERAASRLSEGGFATDTRVAQTKASMEAARAGVQAANSGVESAKSGIQAAEASVAAAENELSKLEIRAPFSGILESDTAELGTLMQTGGLCATIIQLETIKLVGFVPETLVDRVEIGATANARLSSGREVTGQVTFISRAADPTTRTFRVDVDVANDDLAIRDGQTAEIAIQSDGQMAHILPQSALTLNDDGDLGVRIVQDNKAVFNEIAVIRDTPDGIWVSGLDDVADVIVTGQEYVTDGVAVATTYREASQ